MIYKYLTLINIILCLRLTVFSQTNNVDTLSELLAKRDYKSFNELRNKYTLFLNSPLKEKYIQHFGILHSFYSNYDSATYYFSLIARKQRGNFDTALFKSFRPVSALEVLDSVSKKSNIIIFNEAHHVPRNRVTLILFLDKLYKNGFRYLALESLYENDSCINKRKYPLSNISGFYVDEPCYGNLIREALKLGFKLIPYEVNNNLIKNSSVQDIREQLQAKNIVERILKKNATAKIIVLCGYGHGTKIKVGDGSFNFMGYYLKELTGIEPFVVQQQKLNENFPQLLRDDYLYIQKNIKLVVPSIFLNASNKPWSLYESEGDCGIYNRETTIIRGRPDWLSFREKNNYYSPQIFKQKFPYLIQAISSAEGLNSVPVDQFEVYSEKDFEKSLILYKGKYIIRYLDKNGNEFFKYKIKI